MELQKVYQRSNYCSYLKLLQLKTNHKYTMSQLGKQLGEVIQKTNRDFKPIEG